MLAPSNSAELMAPRRGWVEVLRASLPRDQFFAGLYILGCANGFGASMIRALQAGDWTGGTQHISAIALFAGFAGISLFFYDRKGAITTADLLVAGVFLIGIALPVAEINWAAITALSFYILLFANDGGVAPARSPDPARVDGSYVVEPTSVCVLRQDFLAHRCHLRRMASGHRPTRQHRPVR